MEWSYPHTSLVLQLILTFEQEAIKIFEEAFALPPNPELDRFPLLLTVKGLFEVCVASGCVLNEELPR